MRKITLSVLMVAFLTACDIFGDFEFIIDNQTDSILTVAYVEQNQCPEDVFPTYNHGDDYESIRLSDSDSILRINPYKSDTFEYFAGLVNMYFPTKKDTPEAYDISPLWDRISYILAGTDTIDPAKYAKKAWDRSGSTYTLRLTLDKE